VHKAFYGKYDGIFCNRMHKHCVPGLSLGVYHLLGEGIHRLGIRLCVLFCCLATDNKYSMCMLLLICSFLPVNHFLLLHRSVSGLLANQTANIQADILIHLLVLTIHQ